MNSLSGAVQSSGFKSGGDCGARPRNYRWRDEGGFAGERGRT